MNRRDEQLQFFVYAHLPEHLQKISAPFRDMAAYLLDCVPDNRERTAALRKLVEAKDCAVRALIYQSADQ